MFFHYDCHVGDRSQLSVREGQAGFFTNEELADSAGCLWTAEEQEVVEDARLDSPTVDEVPRAMDAAMLHEFSRRGAAAFGDLFGVALAHTRSPAVQGGDMLLLDRVTSIDPTGGPWGRGYLRGEFTLDRARLPEEHWFYDGHFKNDPCMPGTLMFEGCLQAMSIYLAAMGYTLRRDGWRFQPKPETPFPLSCRGQATPTSKLLTYEIFVEEMHDGPIPTLFADVLCTVDGLKAFHGRRIALELVPDWPLEAMPELLSDISDPEPVAVVDGFKFGYASMLAAAWGRPSDAFGPMYERFDGPRAVARLPGPPYHFMSRVRSLDFVPGEMKPGAKVSIDYDIPDSAWYFDVNGAPTMPFAVLLEAALQPCGWLASAVGSALTVDSELGFRNLDGSATLYRELVPTDGTLTTHVELLSVSSTAGMIVQAFKVDCEIDGERVYELHTVFGFFPPAALANQAGLPVSGQQREFVERSSGFVVDLGIQPGPYWASERPHLADPMLLMLDRVTGYWPGAGAAELGQLRAEKDVDQDEWFFKAHFFQDPVQPGSLGLEALLQLLQFFMLEERMDDGIKAPRFEPVALGTEHSWKYRGQVLLHNKTIESTIEIVERGEDEKGAYAFANGSLWVDGKRIYEAKNLGMRIVAG
jgi:3-hydroxymyristoyl/3-hydroxydecanoyl-(acyl carrier protein) dehydratase